jgi:hypothetical protein
VNLTIPRSYSTYLVTVQVTIPTRYATYLVTCAVNYSSKLYNIPGYLRSIPFYTTYPDTCAGNYPKLYNIPS